MCGLRKRCDFNLEIGVLLWFFVRGSKAQVEDSSCYGPGSIATSVIVTIIVTIFLLYVLYLIWKRYWLKRKGKHLVLETDPERGKKNEYAYDNAGFKDVTSTPSEKAPEKTVKPDSTKSKWSHWSPLGVLTAKNEKQKTLDDSALQTEQIKIVSLKSHDFTGLGFNICGNMRDGIFIKDVLHRGPASESGKLNPGDRIKSVAINFEHVVYEDALTILSYASPYEVILEAQSGKTCNLGQVPPSSKTTQLGHPLYRSSSTTDLLQIEKTTKKRLFPSTDNVGAVTTSAVSSPYSSLQKTTRSNAAATLERSPKHEYQNPDKASPPFHQQHLKTQLEQKIFPNHKQQLRTIKDDDNDDKLRRQEPQKTENKYQRFGVKVLPIAVDRLNSPSPPREQTSPKSSELSQNDNNINLERRHLEKLKTTVTVAEEEVGSLGVDEVDKSGRRAAAAPPPIKKREKSAKSEEDEEIFIRRNDSTNGSGIKRDKDGIPQEIPAHMLNAAVVARRNRKATANENGAPNPSEDIKSPKKLKGRAPPPPDDKFKSTGIEQDSSPAQPIGLDDICNDDDVDVENAPPMPETPVPNYDTKQTTQEYGSDSDIDTTDNQSSVNTIELNAGDITVHQTEDSEEIQNRRTASTGDLTKIQKTRKTSTGTLERAQSLDITDTTMPLLNKKRKGGSTEENFDGTSESGEKVHVQKEPRLSLALDGLNTFQRSRLKKSTEWGNLEDAVLNLDKDEEVNLPVNGSLDYDSPQLNTLTDKIHEIKDEHKGSNGVTQVATINPTKKAVEQTPIEFRLKPYLTDTKDSEDDQPKQKENTENANNEHITHTTWEIRETNKQQHIQPLSLLINSSVASENLLLSERRACDSEPYYNSTNKMYDTNVSDDIKVSRHSLGSLEGSDNFKSLNTSNGNVSNILIGDRELGSVQQSESRSSNSLEVIIPPAPPCVENDELYTTALNLQNDRNCENSSVGYEKVSVSSPDANKSVKVAETAFREGNDMVTVEGPTSLTLEISDDGYKTSDKPQIINKSFQISSPSSSTVDTQQEHRTPKSNFSFTYITEIQVLTPNNNGDSSTTATSNVRVDDGDQNQTHTSFMSSSKSLELLDHQGETNNSKSASANEKIDPQKELHKIREIAEEQLKKLPEMRFSTSSYETNTKLSDNCSPHIDQLRSNFEKSPSKSPPKIEPANVTSKSRIPVATSSKTPPTSPERRDSRNFDMEIDKEIVAIMSSPMHSASISSNLKYQPKASSKNVSVTSIRSNSKIPSGFPNRPPVPPRKYESNDGEGASRLSTTNGSVDTSFKQWIFNPNDNSVTNLTLTTENNKIDGK